MRQETTGFPQTGAGRKKEERGRGGWRGREAFLVNSQSTLRTTHIPAANRGADGKNK